MPRNMSNANKTKTSMWFLRMWFTASLASKSTTFSRTLAAGSSTVFAAANPGVSHPLTQPSLSFLFIFLMVSLIDACAL